jgi:DNA polymerase III subunit delta'
MELPNLHNPLYGHDGAISQIAHAIATDSLPHAYLLTGPQGIGKATLGWHVAAHLLAPAVAPHDDAEVDLFGDTPPKTSASLLAFNPDDPIISRMQQGSDGRFLWLRPAYDEKKKVFKSEISVDQVRSIGKFLSLTSGDAGRKIILIDSADIMNNAAANSLLKWLEEPPARTLFLLVAHRAGVILPTIISRCSTIALTPLSQEDFARIVGKNATTEMLYHLTAGAAGLALAWQSTKWQHYWQQLLSVASSDSFPIKAAQQLSGQMAKDAAFNTASVQRLFEILILDSTKLAACGISPIMDAPEYQQACHTLAKRHSKEKLQRLWAMMLSILGDADALYLVKQQVIFNLLASLFSLEEL